MMSKLEDRLFEIIQAEEQKGKRLKKNKQELQRPVGHHQAS